MKSNRSHNLLMRRIASAVEFQLRPPVFASAISHGGTLRGAELRAMGQQPGIYDWLISAPGVRGWIEVKTGESDLSTDQRKFRDTVRANGEFAEIAHNVGEFFAHLKAWGVPMFAPDEVPTSEWNAAVPW